MADESQALDAAFEAIEEAILPSLTAMLDTLLEAASLARPGIDAATYAAELKTLGCEIESLRRQVEDAAAARETGQAIRAA
ncbi:MAG: hypothetical protein JO013_12905 [Alphaproteobacteria bacterium]|nr:hypothetical protein [Alphaproteobacteria bacterium]